MPTLADQLAACTRAAELWEPLEGARIRCLACGLRCPIPAGFTGVCKVRFNRAGKLYAPFGYVNAVRYDPIEKKPFFHVLPGARTMSFGMLGCNLHCAYCQNWVTSQSLRDLQSTLEFTPTDPAKLVWSGARQKAQAIISTYNEPLITSEWAVALFRQARFRFRGQAT